jgi:hypothetical protein
MNKQAWQRLHQIVRGRIDQLGETHESLHAKGGPSPATIRGLKNREGRASVKQTRSLLDLDAVLGWNAGTARGLINDDRTGWTKAALEAEEYDLVYTNLPDPIVAPESKGRLTDGEREIRTIQTMVAAALRAMDDDTRADAVKAILRAIGI